MQTSFILGYLDHQHIFEKKSLEFKLCARGGPQLISDWIYSLLQVNGNDITPFAMTQDELLREYFKLETGYSVRAIFIREDTDLAEDQWVTKRNRYGKLYRFEIKDDTAYGDKEVLGGSYEFVKHFADSKTYEVHHLIPAKLLELTKILGYLDGPCIRMEKEDHAKTSSYKNNRMLHEKYFRKQKIYLETNNIRAAVEMEIADIQDKFGSKYDDAIREVRKYVAKLEKQLKK